jgi:hypothetical protein
METIPQQEPMRVIQTEIPVALHKHLRVQAAKRDTNIKTLIIESVVSYLGQPPAIADDDQDAA